MNGTSPDQDAAAAAARAEERSRRQAKQQHSEEATAQQARHRPAASLLISMLCRVITLCMPSQHRVAQHICSHVILYVAQTKAALLGRKGAAAVYQCESCYTFDTGVTQPPLVTRSAASALPTHQ